MTYHYMDPSGQPCLAIFLCKKQLGPSQHHLAYKLCMAMGKFLTLAEHWVTFKISKFAYEMYKMLCMIHYWHIWSLYQIYGTHISAADDKSLWIGSLLSGNFATQALFMSDRRAINTGITNSCPPVLKAVMILTKAEICNDRSSGASLTSG